MIAVLTATLDWPDGLLQLASSLRAQTCQEFQWYIESPVHPDSLFLKRITNIYPPSKIVIADDTGIYQAFNILQASHNCSHSVFINDTDYLADRNSIHDHPESFIASPISVIGCGDMVISHDYFMSIYMPGKTRILCNHPGLVHPVYKLRSICYPENFKVAGDLAFLYSTIYSLNISVKHIDAPQVCFRLGGASSKYYFRGLREKVVVYQKYAPFCLAAWFDFLRSVAYLIFRNRFASQ